MNRAALGLWLGVRIAGAQTPQPEPEIVQHQAPATFSSRVNLVSVPVVVRDRDGKAIGGLKQEDFQLFDKGRAQVITKFSVETSMTGVGAGPSPSASPSVEPETTTPANAPVLPQRFVAFVFDDVHMKPGDLLYARRSANRELDRITEPTSRTGIFTTSGRTTLDFTNDLEKLHAAINGIQPWTQATDEQHDCPYVSFYAADWEINKTFGLSPGLTDAQVLQLAGADPILAALLQETAACVLTHTLQEVLERLRPAAQMALQLGNEETGVSFNVLRDLIRRMSALPGTRSVVLVGPGFLVPDDYRINENEIFDKAIHSNVTINTLDIRGVATPPGYEASDKGHAADSTSALIQAEQTEADAMQDLLAEVAAGTGGRFFHNDNGIEEGIQQLAARPEYVYVLGFSPDNLKFDGSYHRLKVTIKNSAKTEGTKGEGIKGEIEARHGYWAPNHAVDPAEEAREEVEDAVFSREEMLGIPVKVHTEFFKQDPAKAQLTVETRVDMRGLKFKKADDRNRDNLTVVTSLFDENGRYLKGTQRTFEMNLRDQTLDVAMKAGLTVKEGFDIPPGRYIARVVVRDSEGNSLAAQNQGIEIQ